jgi:hypothetical protein
MNARRFHQVSSIMCNRSMNEFQTRNTSTILPETDARCYEGKAKEMGEVDCNKTTSYVSILACGRIYLVIPCHRNDLLYADRQIVGSHLTIPTRRSRRSTRIWFNMTMSYTKPNDVRIFLPSLNILVHPSFDNCLTLIKLEMNIILHVSFLMIIISLYCCPATQVSIKWAR